MQSAKSARRAMRAGSSARGTVESSAPKPAPRAGASRLPLRAPDRRSHPRAMRRVFMGTRGRPRRRRPYIFAPDADETRRRAHEPSRPRRTSPRSRPRRAPRSRSRSRRLRGGPHFAARQLLVDARRQPRRRRVQGAPADAPREGGDARHGRAVRLRARRHRTDRHADEPSAAERPGDRRQRPVLLRHVPRRAAHRERARARRDRRGRRAGRDPGRALDRDRDGRREARRGDERRLPRPGAAARADGPRRAVHDREGSSRSPRWRPRCAPPAASPGRRWRSPAGRSSSSPATTSRAAAPSGAPPARPARSAPPSAAPPSSCASRRRSAS